MVPTVLTPAELVGIDLYVMTHGHEDHLDNFAAALMSVSGFTGFSNVS